VRSCEDAEGRSAIILEGSWIRLRISEPGQVGTIELDLLRRSGEGNVLSMHRVEGDVGGLDLADGMEWCIIRSDEVGDGKLAAPGYGMDSEGGVAMRTGSDEDWSFSRVPGGASGAPFRYARRRMALVRSP